MIGGPKFTSGSGGGAQVTVMNDSTHSTTQSSHDPTNDPVFSGGKTGSEIMAEAGDPSSVATIDSDASSVQEKMKQDGISSTVETFKDLAKDGNDSNDAATFDQVDQSNADDLQQGVNELAGAAQDVVSGGSSGGGGSNSNVPSQAETAARNAAAAAPGGAGGGSSSGPGGLLEAVVSFLVSLVRTLFGGQ